MKTWYGLIPLAASNAYIYYDHQQCYCTIMISRGVNYDDVT